MGVRVAFVASRQDACSALWAKLGECPGIQESRILQPGLGFLPQALAYRPDLIVSGELGAAAIQAAAYRSLFPRSRLLLCATDAPRRHGLRERLILSRADAVLAEGGAVALAMEQLPVPASRVVAVAVPFDPEPFLGCGETRPAADAHRIVYAGDLSPEAGVADLLAGVAACGEDLPNRSIEIWWAGEGDLAGVLAAQPLPSNVSQRFLGRLDPAGLARVFGQCGLLAAPALSGGKHLQVAQALAAGLPVLGSRRSRTVRQLVREDVNGWLFDTLQPLDIMQAIRRALDTPPARLDRMRQQARTLVHPPASLEFTGQLSQAIAAALSAPDRKPLTQPDLQLVRASTPAR